MSILKKKTKKPITAVKKQTRLSAKSYSALIRPYISQKTGLQASLKQFVFEVGLRSTKKDVKNAIKEVFGLLPTKVNFIKTNAKTVRFGMKTGKRRKKKKAVVMFRRDEKLDVLTNV